VDSILLLSKRAPLTKPLLGLASLFLTGVFQLRRTFFGNSEALSFRDWGSFMLSTDFSFLFMFYDVFTGSKHLLVAYPEPIPVVESSLATEILAK
jgi:hypothetical protein